MVELIHDFSSQAGNTMKTFLQRFAGLVLSVLHGFDRLVFRGHLRQLSYPHGMECYLSANRVLLKDFDAHVQQVTTQLTEASLASARQQQRPIVYLASSGQDKEHLARQMAERDRIDQGLIAVFKCVEPCWSFEVHRNRDRRLLELQAKQRKCTFLYHYFRHPTFGFMHARVQTWFPFPVQVCLNGREWLAQQMDQAGLGYQRCGNKFTALENAERAQQLLRAQLRTAWPKTLDAIRRTIHPAHPKLLGRLPADYYWSVYQSEYASDILFRSVADAERLYQPWLRHVLTHYRSTDVLRFFGGRVRLDGHMRANFAGEVTTNLRDYEEGVRLKHWHNGNSIKLYNCGPILRIETTINHPEQFRVYRSKENDPDGPKDWRVMRRGVADLARRAELSEASNGRYAEAAAAVAQTVPLSQLAEPLCRRVPARGKGTGRKERALNPLAADDAALLEAVSDPALLPNGLRNRDLVHRLYPQAASDEKERRRRSARVTRLIRLLRAHGLLHKVGRRHRYLISPTGQQTIRAVLAARDANAESLTRNVA
jgi:hypothetical protein